MEPITLMRPCLFAYSRWKHSLCSTIWTRNLWRDWVFKAKFSKAEALPCTTQMVQSFWKIRKRQSRGQDLQASLEERLSSMSTVTRRRRREIISNEAKSNKWTLILTQSWTQTLNSLSPLFPQLPTSSHSNHHTSARKVSYHRWALKRENKLEALLVMDCRR